MLVDEVRNATKILGTDEKDLYIFDFNVRNFYKFRQEILDELIKLKQSLNPDLVIIPSQNDLHQGHFVIYQEGLRAFKDRSILSYELPWNNLTFNNACFSILDHKHMRAKRLTLKEYKS